MISDCVGFLEFVPLLSDLVQNDGLLLSYHLEVNVNIFDLVNCHAKGRAEHIKSLITTEFIRRDAYQRHDRLLNYHNFRASSVEPYKVIRSLGLVFIVLFVAFDVLQEIIHIIFIISRGLLEEFRDL